MSAFRKKSFQTGISSGNGLNKCLGKMFDLLKIHCIFFSCDRWSGDIMLVTLGYSVSKLLLN